MNNSTLTQKADQIWSVLNTADNAGKTKQEKVELIKPLLLEIGKDEREIGRRQVINHFKGEIELLSRPA